MSIAKKRVLLITGFAPVKLPQLVDMGIPTDSISLLSQLAGKDTLQLSVPTVAPAVLGRYLAERGIPVAVRDYFLDDIDDAPADVIGISSTFMGLQDVGDIAARLRATHPAAAIVLGGPLSWSLAPAGILAAVPELDYIIMKEGERTFAELVARLASGEDPTQTPGLAYRAGGTVRENAPALPLSGEEIPAPDWTLLGIPSARRLPVLPVETSRGCPFACAYCSETTYWGKPVRYKAIERVVAELKDNITRLGISTFRFTDSCFSAPPARCGALCDAIYEQIISQGLPLRWSSYARVSNLTRDLLTRMKRAGCVALDIGVESGAAPMLRAMGRHYDPAQAIEVAATARALGIITNFNVVVGFPGETRATVMATAALIDNAAPDTYSCFQLYLAPHTQISEAMADYRLEGRGLSWRHATMTSAEAEEGIRAIAARVTRSANLPGGEYLACYFAALGFSVDDIRGLYRDITRVGTGDTEALQRIGSVVGSLRGYL